MNDQNDGYMRSMSALERAHLRGPNNNVIMVAIVKGIISKDKFQAAMKKVNIKHPLLRSRVKIVDNEAYFVSNEVPEIPIKHIKSENGETWKHVAAEEIQYRFDCEKGPLIKFTLVHNSDNQTALLINCHHLICDGLSLIYLIRDLITFLTSSSPENIKTLIPPEMNENNIPVSIKPGFLSRLILKILKKKLAKDDIVITESDAAKLHNLFWQKNKNNISAWSFDKNITEALIDKCKKEGVSVNSAITAAMMAAQQEVEGDKEFLSNVIVSVDFRDRLKKHAGETFAKFASAVRPEMLYDFSASFWENSRQVDDKIKGLLTDENIFASQQLEYFPKAIIDAPFHVKYGLVDSDIIEKLIAKKNLDKISVGFIITNLGKLPIKPQYEEYIIESIYGPFVFSDTMEKYLGVVTLNNQLHFGLSFGETFIAENKIYEIINQFNSKINESLA